MCLKKGGNQVSSRGWNHLLTRKKGMWRMRCQCPLWHHTRAYLHAQCVSQKKKTCINPIVGKFAGSEGQTFQTKNDRVKGHHVVRYVWCFWFQISRCTNTSLHIKYKYLAILFFANYKVSYWHWSFSIKFDFFFFTLNDPFLLQRVKLSRLQ